jgi:hypothetical protein
MAELDGDRSMSSSESACIEHLGLAVDSSQETSSISTRTAHQRCDG